MAPGQSASCQGRTCQGVGGKIEWVTVPILAEILDQLLAMDGPIDLRRLVKSDQGYAMGCRLDSEDVNPDESAAHLLLPLHTK